MMHIKTEFRYRFIGLILLLVTTLASFSQNIRCGATGTVELGTYDVRHFIAPQYARTGLGVPGDLDSGYLVLSTISTIPIIINIKNALAYKNPGSSLALNQTVSISLNSPLVINLSKAPYGTRGYGTRNMISGNTGGTIDSTQGLILESIFPFYAIIRHKSGSQGNYLTSKGRLALGKRFRSGHIYNNANISNVKSEHISVMAMEDSTSINITDLPTGMVFVNQPTFPIVLNRYESFTLAALQDSGANNTLVNQLNGALITSNKNISVVSGSFLGGGEGSGRDIGVDQIVPADYLGQDFFIVKGMGSINMEVPMVVADYDNTEIFLNGSGTPIATINSGQHYMIFNQWGTDSTMIIKTSKPSYLYQSLGANNSNGNGFMIMSPLNLNLENQKLVIPQPNQIGNSTIYIVTDSAAIVKIDGTPITGGIPFASNPKFVRYTITGSVNTTLVESTETYFCTNVVLSGARGAGCSYTGFPNSFAIRDNIQVSIGKSDTSNYLVNDIRTLYDFKLDTICTNPMKGSIQTLSNGKVVYTPYTTATGCDTLIYSIKDSSTGIYDQNLVIYCINLDLSIDSIVQIKCHGDTNGWIRAKAIGGHPGYLFSIKTKANYGLTSDSFKTSPIFSGLKADTFILKVLDTKGNTDTVHIILRQPSKLIAKIDSVRKSSICIRDSSFLFASSSGGIQNYKYLWSPQISFKNDTLKNNIVYPLNSGFVKFSVSDSNLCISSDSTYIEVRDTSFYIMYDITCKTNPVIFNGQSLNISGIYRDTFVNSKGCDSFLYLHLMVNDTTRKDSFQSICKNYPIIFNGQSINTSGLYKDTLINSKGCDSFLYLHLTVNDTTKKDSFRSICKNNPIVFNGQSINTSGIYKDTFNNSKGCDSFLYLHLTVNDTTKKDSFRSICKKWPVVFNGQTLNTSGIYKDTFMNAKGCDSFLYLHLTVYDTTKKDSFQSICKNYPIVFNGLTLNNPGIYKDTFTNANGCDSFLYLHLTVIDTTRKDSFKNICINQPIVFNGQVLNTSGIYKDTLVNAKGCDSFLYLHLTVNPIPLVNAGPDLNRVNCVGDSVLIGTTENPNYSYDWNPNLFLHNNTVSKPWVKTPTAQNYILRVTDNVTGCQGWDTVKVDVIPNNLNIIKQVKQIRCFGENNGEIKINGYNGYPAYSYTFGSNNFSDTNILKNLAPGIFQFTVKDAKGCLYNDSIQIIEPSPLKIDSVFMKNIRCHQGDDGEIKVFVTGGNNPYHYNWSSSSLNAGTIKDLKANQHQLTVTDANGCLITNTFTLTEPDLIRLQDTIIQKNKCNGDSMASITVSILGGVLPYSYNWNNGSKTKDITNLKQGFYKLTITDAMNCKQNYSFSIDDYPQLVFDSIIALDFNCDLEGSIILAAKGGLPNYEYSIDAGLSFQPNRRIKVENPDTYQVHIRDNNGCVIKSSAKVKGPKRMEIQAYPKDTLTLPGEPILLGFDYTLGDPNNVQAILWKPTDGLSCTDCINPIATPHAPMQYTVTIFYNNRCTATETINIRHNTDNNELYIPNSFSPTSANIENQTFKIYSNQIVKSTLKIFNRTGEKMFESDNAHRIGWDGTYKGEPVKEDVFIYWAEVTYLNGKKVVKSGDITLVR